MAKDIAAEEALAEATRVLAAGVIKPCESKVNTINITSLFKDSADDLALEFGEDIDLSGPAFSDADRADFQKFQGE
eukprot:1757021-Pyramimonas_sp.AAC.1